MMRDAPVIGQVQLINFYRIFLCMQGMSLSDHPDANVITLNKNDRKIDFVKMNRRERAIAYECFT